MVCSQLNDLHERGAIDGKSERSEIQCDVQLQVDICPARNVISGDWGIYKRMQTRLHHGVRSCNIRRNGICDGGAGIAEDRRVDIVYESGISQVGKRANPVVVDRLIAVTDT